VRGPKRNEADDERPLDDIFRRRDYPNVLAASREHVQAARLVQFSISKYCKTRSEKYADLARLRFERLTAMALREIEPLSPADPALDKFTIAGSAGSVSGEARPLQEETTIAAADRLQARA
jgi:hypothetical protein